MLHNAVTTIKSLGSSHDLASSTNNRTISQNLPGSLKEKWAEQIETRPTISEQERINIQIRRRKWGWIGHTLRKKSEALEPDWLIAAGAYPGFCSMKRLGVFLIPLDGMLVHRRSLFRNLLGFPNNLPVPIYTPGWREAL